MRMHDYIDAFILIAASLGVFLKKNAFSSN